MHSSISLSLEPGLERGVPWGRDLYTFVTSAAGHMMRTLQKPRKNRPLKRQVNHRRFLHNMIQRKFADIEASNHRLASVLYLKGDEKTPDTPDLSINPSPVHLAEDKTTDDKEMSQKTSDSQRPEIVRKPRPKSRASKKSDQKPLDPISMETRPSETTPFYDDEAITEALFSLDAQAEASLLQFDSPLSPLSLDSCDFAAQMFTDISSSTNSVEDIMESQWAEIVDLFHSGSSSRRVEDVEEYLESICDCQSDTECSRDDEDFYFERSQCRFENRQEAAESNFFDFASLNTDIIQSESLNTTSFQSTSNQSLGRFELNPLPFEGVAQSFSAPSQNTARCSIATPPYEGDWLFADILTDTAVPRN